MTFNSPVTGPATLTAADHLQNSQH